MDFVTTLAVMGLAAIAVFAATWLFRIRPPDTEMSRRSDRFDVHGYEPAVFVFDNGLLVDATDRAAALIRQWPTAESPWRQLMRALEPGFDDIEARLANLQRGERLDIWSAESAGARTHLQVQWRNGMLRITLAQADEADASILLDAKSVFAAERDSALLRGVSAHAPILIWKTRPDTGEVTWANRAYLDLCDEVNATSGSTWPPPRLFAGRGKSQPTPQSQRVSITGGASGALHWFDWQSHQLDGESLHFARPSDAEVRADGALREFVQTLSKTFAGLPIGLAIFNRSRRLVLFNPALTDLSALRVDFLANQPTLQAFLDEMRNRGSIPEPKDYKAWRQQILDLEAQSLQGTFQETWDLPGNRTFQVTGQPHPQGAMALLFQDITSQVSLTRRFRSDINLAQSVLDHLPEAVAVFSPAGVLTASNAAYEKLWRSDPRTTLGEISILDAIKIWMSETDPTPVWGDVRDFVAETEGRAEWQADVRLTGGGFVACRFTPLATGETLIRFEPHAVTFEMPTENGLSANLVPAP